MTTPPFDASVARQLRQALGMGYEHVAYSINAAYGLSIWPGEVAAWEEGTARPSHQQLNALAGVLWCSPGQLMGAPGTLREYRTAAGLAAEDVARQVGMGTDAYLQAEESGRWPGNDRQSAALASLLRLPLPALLDVTGRTEKLAGLLRHGVTTRWQAYVRPVGKLTGLPRPSVEYALRELHTEYQARMAATLSWGDSQSSVQSDSAAEGEAYLGALVERFWALLSGGSQ